MNDPGTASAIAALAGTLIGFFWGYFIGRKVDNNLIARYERALINIANWENYNLGGDIKRGVKHPAAIAEDVLNRFEFK